MNKLELKEKLRKRINREPSAAEQANAETDVLLRLELLEDEVERLKRMFDIIK